MGWNWERADWPEFHWDGRRLTAAEERFLVSGGAALGAFRHLVPEQRSRLAVESLSDEALASSEIEGELLRRDSVRSWVRRELGLAADAGTATQAERGAAQLMVAVYRRHADELDEETLFTWHRSLMAGRPGLRDIGRYRTHPEPMRIVSRALLEPRVHFEAPPSERVPDEMSGFIAWFNRTGPAGEAPLPSITRAGLAHLYFESIHPFEDGNGRIGRAISEKALAQGLGGATHPALAETILARRRGYYDALSAASRGLNATDWLTWFGGVTLEAQERTRARVEFLIDKTRLLDRVRGELNERQEKVLVRMLREGPEGFEGGLSAGNYVRIARTSPATARRDLGDLVEKGALRRTGERRHTRYHLPIRTRSVNRVTIDASGKIAGLDDEQP